MNRLIATMAAGFLFFCAASLEAKSPDERITALEQQIAAMQKTYIVNNQDVVSAVSRTQTVQDEFNVLKGEVETNDHLIKAQREELMRLITDVQNRLQAIEDRMSIFTGQMSSALGKVSPGAAAETDLYQKAIDLANESKYLEAASAFSSFLLKYPKSQFASKASLWIGECFYSSRDYKRAIKEYQVFVEKYPKDEKVPDAILKQGHSFYELGLLDEARAFYDKVVQLYPNTQAATQAKTRIARIEAKKGGAAPGAGAVAVPGAEASTGSAQSSYPTETIEQQRQKMSGAPAQPQTQQQQPPPKKPALPPREF